MTPTPTTPRRLSGIQPSGNLHLGNYLGAIEQHIAAPDNAFYFVANLHALTTVSDATELRKSTLEVAATYLALGLDIERATLFVQSDVPEVCEIAWYLATASSKGLLDRAHSYKDKVAHGHTASLGLYTYPVLMAADIVAYDTDIVPVGSDQKQHVEMARDMVLAFHSRYGRGVFHLPEHRIVLDVPVPGIDGKKMSKSYGNAIPLFSTGATLKERVMSIPTGSAGLGDPKDPKTCTIFQLYSLMASEAEGQEMAARYRAGGYGYGHAKIELLRTIEERFADPRRRFASLMARPGDIEEQLRVGGRRAREIARGTLERARGACGV